MPKINKYSLPYCNASLDMFIYQSLKIMNSKNVRSTAIADVEGMFRYSCNHCLQWKRCVEWAVLRERSNMCYIIITNLTANSSLYTHQSYIHHKCCHYQYLLSYPVMLPHIYIYL